MISIVRFHPEAEKEFRESILWYSKQQKGLEIEFVLSIDETIERIKRSPEQFPKVYRHLRRAVIKKFPFVILYELSLTDINIVAIFHSKRNPQKVIKRR
jgi:plasmid stabilization system protein ParE